MPISGCVKHAAGTALWSTACGLPQMFSTAEMPCPARPDTTQRSSTTGPDGPADERWSATARGRGGSVRARGAPGLGRRGVCEHHLAVGVADAPQPRDHLAAGLVQNLHLLVHLQPATSSKGAGAKTRGKFNESKEPRRRTCTKPRTVSMPWASRPRPLVLGTRPVQTRAAST